MVEMKVLDSSGAAALRPPGGAVAPIHAPLDEMHMGIGGSINSVREEIDDAFADMKTFHNCEPDHVMRMAQGHSARLSELKVRIARHEDQSYPLWRLVRQRELEPAIQELWNQYQVASRLHTVRELDWKIESGDRG